MVAIVAGRRMDFEANLLRLPGAPYAVEGEVVRNAMQIHLVNKRSVPVRYLIAVEPTADMSALVPLGDVAVPPLGDARAPIVLSIPGPVSCRLPGNRSGDVYDRTRAERRGHGHVPRTVSMSVAAILSSALVMGIAGSGHCTLMCGASSDWWAQRPRGPGRPSPE